MKVMTESELLSYYSGFLQQKLTALPELLRRLNISPDEMPGTQCVAEETVAVPDLRAKMRLHFKPLYPLRDRGMKVLLVDATRHYADRDEGAWRASCIRRSG